MSTDNTLYAVIARIIAGETSPPGISQVARAMNTHRHSIRHVMERMRREHLLETVPVTGLQGRSLGWRVTTRGHSFLQGYVPTAGDAGTTGRLNFDPLLDALGMPRHAPPLPLNARVRIVSCA